MLIKCTIFYTKRCMYEQKWEYSYKETENVKLFL